jgi:hypothetical protein
MFLNLIKLTIKIYLENSSQVWGHSEELRQEFKSWGCEDKETEKTMIMYTAFRGTLLTLPLLSCVILGSYLTLCVSASSSINRDGGGKWEQCSPHMPFNYRSDLWFLSYPSTTLLLYLSPKNCILKSLVSAGFLLSLAMRGTNRRLEMRKKGEARDVLHLPQTDQTGYWQQLCILWLWFPLDSSFTPRSLPPT